MARPIRFSDASCSSTSSRVSPSQNAYRLPVATYFCVRGPLFVPDVCFWHISDVPLALTNVCFEGNNGHDAGVTPFPLMTHSQTKLLQVISERGRPSGRPLKRKPKYVHVPSPHRGSRCPGWVWPSYQGRLFGYTHKQSAGQFAIFTDERCVVSLVVLTKNRGRPGVGVFFGQGFVGRAIMVKFCTDRRLSSLHQGRVYR